MSKTSTKRRLNHRNHIRVPTSTAGTNRTHSRQVAAVAEAKKKASLGDTGNTGADKLRKKTRKKLSHQQAAEARDTLDAEFRDLRSTPINAAQQGLQLLPGDTALAPPPPRTIPESAGFISSVQPSEQSVQDLAGILNTL